MKQLAMAKETLAKLRALTDPRNTTDNLNGQNGDSSWIERVNGWDDSKHDSDERSSGLGLESPHYDSGAHGTNFASDKAVLARDSLVKALGLQVSKLEDDLKAPLLAYFEEMEVQKEDLISSFETMHAQLSKHHEICQAHYKETAEKDACIERLKVDKQTLEIDVENLARENMQLKADKSRTRENGYRLSPGFIEPDELSETLMKENTRLREKLRKYETNNYARMERKIAMQEKLCESFNKDVMSKDSLLKRLTAENQALHEDVKNLQDEVLRVNANRISAEQDKARLQQELQFSEEQVSILREKLGSSAVEAKYLQKSINEANSKANHSCDNLSEVEKEIAALREKCESYRDKLNDKERFLASVSQENDGLTRTVEVMKKELAALRGEERSLKIENERLQRENADREIDRLSSETTSEVNNNKISKMKQQVCELESKVSELELQQQGNDVREAEISHEVLTSLEKHTQVEQQLYLTKKELVQLQGFYDSSEEKRRHLQKEAEDCRQRIASLEWQLQEKKIALEREASLSDVMKDNERLHKENQKLREQNETSKIEIEELEEALQSAREQNSLQRMRLDAHETLMKRKDERIKELQSKLVELHNQIDSLTDEIFKKNREMEGLRMSKKLLEQELNVLRSGKLSSKALYREGAAKDSPPFNSNTDPASPDSGFSETERDKAIDRIRREILSQPQHPVSREEHFPRDGAEKFQADLALTTRRLKETEKRLAEVIAENENLKDKKHEASTLQLQTSEELRKVTEENKELKEKERVLSQALEGSQRSIARGEVTHSLETPLEVENFLAIDEPLIESSALQPVLETIPENAAALSDNEPEKNLIDFVDAADGLNSGPPQEEFKLNQLQNKDDELEGRVHDYEAHLAKLTAEKEDLLTELTNTREVLKTMENKDKGDQVNSENLQRTTEEMKGKIQDYETNLVKVNAENKKLLLELNQTREKLSAMESEWKGFEKEKKELQNKSENLEEKVQDFQNSLEKKTNENKKLLAELKHTRANLKKMESEEKAVRENKQDLQNKTEELEQKLYYYEASLAKTNTEKEGLAAELEHVGKNLKEMESDCKAEQENRIELQKIMQEELSAKDDEVAKLQKELSVICEEQERLEALLESSKETSCEAEDKFLSAQNAVLDFERQLRNARAKEKSLQDLLHQSEESNADLQVQLGEMEQAYRKIDKEAKGLQKEIVVVQQGSAELEREVEEFRAKVAGEQEKQKRAAENLEDLQTHNQHLRMQLQDAEHTLQNSHQEYEKRVIQLEASIREKENDIEQLREELAISEQRYSEIRSLSSNTQTELTDLQAELIETKEQFYTVSQEKARLVHDQKQLEHSIAEKDDKIADLETEKSQDVRRISEQEKKLVDFIDKLEKYENEATKLSEENERLRKNLEEAASNKKELENLLAESNEEKKALEQQLVAAHESITDLETAFERGEDKNSKTEENLRAAKDRLTKLETQLEARQDEYVALEKDYNETERELENTQETLDLCQDKIITLEKKLRNAEEEISELEMARDNGLSNEQLLQQRFATARDNVEKTEAENNELKVKMAKLEKKMGDLTSKQEALEERKEELDKVNRELRKDLEYEREKRSALKQKVEARDRENDAIQRKAQTLERNMAEHEDLYNKEMEEKAKLKDELARAKKNLSELEATKENQEESICEMEEVLTETRGKMATLEQNLEDSIRDNADLHEELEELHRKLKYTKEENSELEKRLQKQKEISDGFRNNLAEREESVMNSNYNRDVAERSLQSLKKDLARKDAKLKMQKEQIDDMEGEAEKVARKVKETESSNKKLSTENEKLVKELADIRVKLKKAQAMFKQKGKSDFESDVPVVRISDVQANPAQADKLIRDWSDKLNTAQTKVTDLETELLRDIKKHEARVHRPRPVPADLRRKSADYVLTDHVRPSRFRSRQRPSTSRDSSVDSLRSTQSMLDYLDDSIVDEKLLSSGPLFKQSSVAAKAVESDTSLFAVTVPSVASEIANPVASENAIPVPSEIRTPVAEGNGSPVDSHTEGAPGFPVKAPAPAKTESASTDTKDSTKGKELIKLDERRNEAPERSSSGKHEDHDPIDWKLDEILEPHIDYQQPLFTEKVPLIPASETMSPKTTEDVVVKRKEHTDLEMDAQLENPLGFDVTTNNVPDLQPGNYPQQVLNRSHLDTETSRGKGRDRAHAKIPDLLSSRTEPGERELQDIYYRPNSPIQAENHFDVKSEEVPKHKPDLQQQLLIEPLSDDLQSFYTQSSLPVQAENNIDFRTEEVESEFQQLVLIEPPSDDLFQFASVPSDNSSSITTVTDLTVQSTSPIFPEQTILAAFDSLDLPEPQPYSSEGEMIDPFEQLMRDAQHGDSKEFDIDDVVIDIPDGVATDDVDNDVTNSLTYDLQATSHGNKVDYSQSDPKRNGNTELVTDDAVDLQEQIGPVSSADGDYGDVIDLPKPNEPVPPHRRLKEKMTPVLFSRGEQKKDKGNGRKRSEEEDAKPYSAIIMADEAIVQTSHENLLKPAERKKKRPKRPPKPTVPAEFCDAREDEVYKSPSQIRKELEEEMMKTSTDNNSSSTLDEKKKPQRPSKAVFPPGLVSTESEETYNSPSQIRKELEKKKNFGGRKKKPERPPKPFIPERLASVEEEGTYKSPSQIRKELEDASKRGERIIIGAKTVGRQSKAPVTDSRSSQYHIEEKDKGGGADHTHRTEERDQKEEEEEEIGKGRLLKLIAAFENN